MFCFTAKSIFVIIWHKEKAMTVTIENVDYNF